METKENNEKPDLRMTLAERFISALTTGALMFIGGIALILLSPVFSIRALFTSKRTDWKTLKKSLDEFGDKLDDMTDPDSDEDWKKDHKKEYGK